MNEYDDDEFSGNGDDVQVRRFVISIDFGTTYTGMLFILMLHLFSFQN
jgi:hypothetical protein